METVYVECFLGISGDMTVGVLLDLGASRDVLVNGMESLNIDGYKMEISKISKNNLQVCDFDVILADKEESEDYFKENRNYYDICKIIDESSISKNDKVDKTVSRIFRGF